MPLKHKTVKFCILAKKREPVYISTLSDAPKLIFRIESGENFREPHFNYRR